MKGFLFSLALIFMLAACAANSSTKNSATAATEGRRQPSSSGPNEYAAVKLRSKGLSEDFLQTILTYYREDQREKVMVSIASRTMRSITPRQTQAVAATA
jgi:uncharacterized lipoprotein YajG